MKLIINTDGASRGNPGEASIGVVIQDDSRNILKKISEYLGSNLTNNEAEYQAVITSLKEAKKVVGKKNTKSTEVEVRADSELLVRQMNGEYKLSTENIQNLFIVVWNLKTEFKSVIFKHIPREMNKEADKLANQALDSQENFLF